LPLESREVLLDAAGAPFPRLDSVRPATPLDEGDAKVQREAIEQVHPAAILGLIVERLFGRMVVATGSGRQGGVHDVPHSVRAPDRDTVVSRIDEPWVPLVAAEWDDVPGV
jgi:hypothetical protein